METKLKPCPFCGGDAYYCELHIDNRGEHVEVYAYCEECKTQTPVKRRNINYCAKDEVAKLWNSRVDQQKL